MSANVLGGSAIDRGNILNNQFAVSEIYKKSEIQGFQFQGQQYLTTQQVADYFEVDIRTIRRYVRKYANELQSNGYRIVTGDELREIKSHQDINVLMSDDHRTARVGIFTIRAFLDMAMLLAESEKAKQLRSLMLNTVIAVINERSGGNTKYINQRDDTYIVAAYYNEGYHKRFINALSKYVVDDPAKYPNYTDRIYQEIFHENTREYKRILDLAKKEKARETMYSEVISAISSFESGVAVYIEERYREKGRRLTRDEVDRIFNDISKSPTMEPTIQLARTKMASLDKALRNVEHDNISDYIVSISQEDYERFLGEKSKSLSERINENLDVLKRLKDK